MISHLGGHNNVTNLDIPLFEFVTKKYNLKSVIDIGCGPAGLKSVADHYGVNWFGIDGDATVINNTDNTICHDFTTGILDLDKNFDLAWSVEFLEHVEEQYIENFMPLFQKARFALVTAAAPGTPGHHHVNCQPTKYWVDIFSQYGLQYVESETDYLKSISTMRKNFFKKSGMFFVNDLLK